MSHLSEEKIYHIFETISGKYDLINAMISFYRHKAWRKDVLNRMGLKRGRNAIDLCCGTGEAALILAQRIHPGVVYGVDFSEKMLARAGEKKEKLKLDNLFLLSANVKKLPFEDNFFHYATLCFGLRNISGHMEALKEIHRILKPGGRLACLETSRPSRPLIRQLYYYYMRYLMPLPGRLLLGSSREYLWLQESTWSFPDKKTLTAQFEEAGFRDIFVREYLGGVAAMHLGIKPLG